MAIGSSDRLVFDQLQHLVARFKTPPELLVRVDDVVEIGQDERWLMQAISRRGLCCSLEVIPCRSRLSEDELGDVSPDLGLVEVSQHGYSHTNRSSIDAPMSEFSDASEYRAALIAEIAEGRDMMREAFPTLFKGGFSAPYDGLPQWLPDVWRELGGQYISCIWNLPRSAPVRIVRVSTDIWNWSHDQMRSSDSVAGELAAHFSRHGRAGLVVHPVTLRPPHSRGWLESLLDALVAGGVTATHISGSIGMARG